MADRQISAESAIARIRKIRATAADKAEQAAVVAAQRVRDRAAEKERKIAARVPEHERALFDVILAELARR